MNRPVDRNGEASIRSGHGTKYVIAITIIVPVFTEPVLKSFRARPRIFGRWRLLRVPDRARFMVGEQVPLEEWASPDPGCGVPRLWSHAKAVSSSPNSSLHLRWFSGLMTPGYEINFSENSTLSLAVVAGYRSFRANGGNQFAWRRAVPVAHPPTHLRRSAQR